MILPVWHNITVDAIRGYYPILADRLATKTALGLDKVVVDIIRASDVGEDQTAPMTSVPDIDLPTVAEDGEAASVLGLLCGGGPLHELEDQMWYDQALTRTGEET